MPSTVAVRIKLVILVDLQLHTYKAVVREVIYPFVCIPREKQLHASYYTILTYGYFSLRNWDKHHCIQDEQANPLLIYAY